MPTFERSEIGKQDGFTGTTLATFDHVADTVMDAHDPFPRSLRAVYVTPGNDNLSLGIPLDDTKGKVLIPFFAGELPSEDLPDGEDRLKEWLTKHLPKEEIWVYANNNFIRSRNAPPGTHRFHLYTIWKWAYSDGSPRMSFTLRTKEELGTTWHSPYPNFVIVVGKDPDDDKFKIDGSHAVQYLDILGLDWDRIGKEIVASNAIWDGHWDSDGRPVEAYFPDANNLCRRLIELFVEQHPGKLPEVQITIEDHDTFGLGPTRGAQTFVNMTPIIIERSIVEPDYSGFDEEVERFLAAWDGVTKVAKENPEANLCVNGKLTQAGKDVAVLYMKPVVAAYPDVVKARHPDGGPAIALPPTKDTWDMDGMISIAMVGEWLLMSHAENKIDLTQFIVESDLLEWVAEHVKPASSDLL